CERAVDPLEIAAGLEAHGVTDRTAARFRHRDVFSLAEEMYARATHDGEPPTPPTAVDAPRVRPAWVLFTLLPGALATATAAARHGPRPRPRLVLRPRGLERPPPRRTSPSQTDHQPGPGGVRHVRTASAPQHLRPVPVRPDNPARPVHRGPERTRRLRPDAPL